MMLLKKNTDTTENRRFPLREGRTSNGSREDLSLSDNVRVLVFRVEDRCIIKEISIARGTGRTIQVRYKGQIRSC
jgi:hypothetical protein